MSPTSTTIPLTVICENIRSAHNVGAIFRAADAAGVLKLLLVGITPTPKNNKVAKTALGAERVVAWEHVWTTDKALKKLAQGTQVLSLELVEGSTLYYEAELRFPMALILGNEVEGVDEKTLEASDGVVHIPMLRSKESLNVSQAFAVVAFDILRRSAK